MEIQRVALLGAGAVGAYFIWGLSEKMGDHFCVIASDERKERLERDGIVINGKKYSLHVKEPEAAKGVDLLLVSCKQDALQGILEDIRNIVDEHTIVISLLNGVSSEEIIGKVIGMEHMLYAVMRIASVREGNRITFSEEHTAGVYIGEKGTREPTERVLAVEQLLKSAGLGCHVMEDIVLNM